MKHHLPKLPVSYNNQKHETKIDYIFFVLVNYLSDNSKKIISHLDTGRVFSWSYISEVPFYIFQEEVHVLCVEICSSCKNDLPIPYLYTAKSC